MASTSKQATSSSDSPPWFKYDVFLSFRGKDTRNSFTAHLHTNLERKVDVYMDDRELERGKPIGSALWKAIEESRFSVVIFSRNYAWSSWCLDELVKIVECMKEKGHTVFPVFYDVDPSEVTDQQGGSYKKAFVEHSKKFKKNLKRVQNWKQCLYTVGNLSGWDVRNRNESEMIRQISEYIAYKVHLTLPAISKDLVGIDSRLEALNGYILEDSRDVLFIGICGMGGIGKTTIAGVIYDKIQWKFEGSCFLANLRKVFVEKDGPCRLQGQLLSETLMECTSVSESRRGVELIKRRLRHKKVLIILDDVDDPGQLEMLAAEQGWFGPGSRIIITSRNKYVWKRHGACKVYEAEKLNYDDALKLFSWKSFKEDEPAEDYRQLSKRVVGYADGLPLALEVLGSFLYGRSIIEWESAINRLNEIPDAKIIDVLRLSFDGLDEFEKKIFLDIACFFKGMKKDRIMRVIDGCGFYANIGISVLVEKCLISVVRDKVWMHDLLKILGEDIVRRESPEEPKKRSRLWTCKDVCRALRDIDKKQAKVESIFLDTIRVEEARWNMKAFSKMRKLRLLKIHNVQLSEGPEYLSDELRFLEWHSYPSTSLPSCFKADKLVELDLSYSSIKHLWCGDKSSINLKIINLSHSLNLTETPDFNGIPNLEMLILEGCASLSTIHPSLGLHKKLQYVNLANCSSLGSLLSSLEMKSLRAFNLDGCSELGKFPDLEGNMSCLMELRLTGTSIVEVPSSIHHLDALRILSINDCKNLESIPRSISGLKSLKELDLSGCSQLRNLPESLGEVESLEKLDLSGTSICQPSLPTFRLKNLRELSFDGCKSRVLPSFSGLCSLEKLDLCACDLQEGAVPEDIGRLSSLRVLDLSRNNFVSLPQSINQLSRLEMLMLEDCRMLKSLPEVPSNLQTVKLNGCISLTQVPDPTKLCCLESPSFECLNCWALYKDTDRDSFGPIMLKKYLQGPSHPRPGFGIAIPGSKVPRWFMHQSEGSSISVQVPPKLVRDRSGWIGFSACVAFSAVDEVLSLSCDFKAGGSDYYSLPLYISCHSIHVLSDHLWLFYMSFDYLRARKEWKHESFSNMELSFHFQGQGVRVNHCVVSLECSPSITSASMPSYVNIIAANKSEQVASLAIALFYSCPYFDQWMGNVFLCFGADDNDFTRYLYTALVQKGVIWGGWRLQSEKEIEPRLLKAIEESRLSVVIYARDCDYTSRLIVKRLLSLIQSVNKDMEDIVFPTFYDLQPVGSTGSCRIIFDKDIVDAMEKMEKVERWRITLTEVFISSSEGNYLISAVLGNLNSSVLQEIPLAWGLKLELENLKNNFAAVQAVLQDAEEKQWKNGAVKIWLTDLKDAAYDADDVLEEITIEAQGRCREQRDFTKRIRSFFSLDHNPFVFGGKMAHKLKAVREKFDAIANLRHNLPLVETCMETESNGFDWWQTGSLVNESEICGRDEEEKELNNLLLTNSNDLSVYVIYGMGGLGKTTLAQSFYNNTTVKEHFDFRIWIRVSDDFDIQRLARTIIESIGGFHYISIQELALLQQLQENMSGKRFLLVMDDIWDLYHERWNRLKDALRFGARGSVVLVTTRTEAVALQMESVFVQHLGRLSDDTSWHLFEKLALSMRSGEEYEHLKSVGEAIVNKCGGVPLAIKLIGSMMRSKRTKNEWLSIKESEFWDLEDDGSLIALKLSYNNLPSYLKQCFALCCLFPKGYEMKKDQLVELWMANGFIPCERKTVLREMGHQMFDELVGRSLFQDIKEDELGNITCKMHHLLHDLAQSVSKSECCLIEDGRIPEIPTTVRHVAIFPRGYIAPCGEDLLEGTSLHSFFSTITDDAPIHVSDFSSYLVRQEHLRILSLSGYKFRELPVPIANLKHLRHLDVSESLYLRTLPESIISLFYLQTLNLRDCRRLHKLPKGMSQMKNLMYLDIRGCDSLRCMPVGMGQLTNLRKLDMFIVGEKDGGRIGELQTLNHIGGELSIKDLGNVKNLADARNADLMRKTNLQSLSLFWGKVCNSNFRKDNDENVLCSLHPNSNLKHLEISGYGGLKFPNWMIELRLQNLLSITLKQCSNCEHLPPFGKLQFLQGLILEDMDGIKSIDSDLYGDGENPFPSLERLSLNGMMSLKHWASNGNGGGEIFTRLRDLWIRDCPNLVELPIIPSVNSHLQSLTTSGLCELQSLSNQLGNLSSLRFLEIGGCHKFGSLPSDLQNLNSLRSLNLINLPINSLCALPPSLTLLCIHYCNDLTSLTESIQHLTSLRSLEIRNCKGLSCLPGAIGHLASLSTMSIGDCPKLTSLPEEIRSLYMLRRLNIQSCPNLERRCQKHTGEDWPKIAHIPQIVIGI